MHLEVFVEELSAEEALKRLLPQILREDWNVRYHAFQGKPDLLAKLPFRLRGYSRWLPPDWRVLVLVDEDREDCKALKQRLEEAAEGAGLTTKTGAGAGQFDVLNRIAVEELEAWFLGDAEALAAAYPGVSPTLHRRARYRDPDAITGGTWETLGKVLQRAGFYSAGMPKVEVAQRVSQRMDFLRNRSHSFSVFVNGLRALVAHD